MAMALPLSGDSGQTMSDSIATYLSYGLSILPIAPGTKKPFGLLLPNGTWKPYQQHAPKPDEAQSWVNQHPDLGIGIICGKVSGRLYCLDVDDVEFATFIETKYGPQNYYGMWVVRTGSNKLHLYLRSRTELYTTNMVGSGRKLADIRGDGQANNGPSYMVAPPSRHPTGPLYRTLSGSPEHVPEVADAAWVFTRIKEAFLGQSTVLKLVSQGTPEADLDTGDRRILPRDESKTQEVMASISGAQLSRKVRKAIMEGATFGDGMWSGAPSDSEIDHRVIEELRAAGLSVEQIEQVFAWSPLGQNCYANTQRGNHGRGYLSTSIIKIDQQAASAATAAQSASGNNFKVIEVTRIGYEPPIYECVIHNTETDTQGKVNLRVEDIMDEYLFKKQVMKELNFLPDLPKSLEGRKFQVFGGLITKMAGMEAVPQVATTAGHLRGLIRQIISQGIDQQQPEDERMMRLGWREGAVVHVRGVAVLHHLQAVKRPSPTPEQVWSALRAIGGQEEGHRWPSGRRERLWCLPWQEDE